VVDYALTDLKPRCALQRLSRHMGIPTTKHTRKEGHVFRNNFPWAIGILVYLIIIGLLYASLAPHLFVPPQMLKTQGVIKMKTNLALPRRDH